MTGPAPGKIEIENAQVYIKEGLRTKVLQDAHIYIHLKGYSYARVTHLDIEHPELNGIIEGEGGYYRILGIPYGLSIAIDKDRYVVIRHKLLNNILEDGESTFTWVGSKIDGIYIGFKKQHIKRLEELASEISKI